jgi:hypothetical protein
MFLRKLRLMAEFVGFIAITLLCLYGGLAFFANARLVFATMNDSSPALVSHATANEKIDFAPLTTISQQTSNPSSVVPPFLNYQGALRNQDGIPLPDAQYTMTFRIYDEGNSVTKPIGTEIWSEEIFGVTVRGGRFGVLLGNTAPIPTDLFLRSDRFLGVQVVGHDEMQPRQRFSSVPYAIAADQAYGLSAATGGPQTQNVISVNGYGGLEIGPAPWLENSTDVELKIFGDGQGNLLLQNRNGQWGRLDRWEDRFEIKGSDEVRILTDNPEGKIIIGSIVVDNQRLFIRSGGDIVTFDGEDRVGIGIADPEANLDVNGNLLVRGELDFKRTYETYNSWEHLTDIGEHYLGQHDICTLALVEGDGCKLSYSYTSEFGPYNTNGRPSWILMGGTCSTICMDYR